MKIKNYAVILKSMNKVCNNYNNGKYNEIPNNIKFEVVQLNDLLNMDANGLVNNIYNFYNENFTGNKDFMHVPTRQDIIYNLENNIIITAKNTETNEIFAISTLKHKEKGENNPYYNDYYHEYFEITGVLTKKQKDNNYKLGLGKRLYEVMLRGVNEYNSYFDTPTKVICEIDCRNICSYKAFTKAVLNIEKDNINIGSTFIDGINVVRNSDESIKEAPTLVLVNDSSIKSIYNSSLELNYKDVTKDNYNTTYDELYKYIYNNISSSDITRGYDKDLIVDYVKFNKLVNVSKLNIETNGIEKGNNRTIENNIYDNLENNVLDNAKEKVLTLCRR